MFFLIGVFYGYEDMIIAFLIVPGCIAIAALLYDVTLYNQIAKNDPDVRRRVKEHDFQFCLLFMHALFFTLGPFIVLALAGYKRPKRRKAHA